MIRRAGTLAGLALLALGGPAGAQRDQGYDVRVAERVELAPGQVAPLTVTIAVDRGLTVSRDAPVILDVAPDAGVMVKKRRLGRGDAVDPEADAPRFAVPVRGDAAGEHAVRIHLRFWLCRTRACRPIEVRRTATVAIAGQTPSADAGGGAGPGPGSGGPPARPR